MRPRLTIAALLAIVAFLAVGLAALREPSPLAANVAYTAALAMLVVATFQVLVRRGNGRARWAGYLLVAGAYLAAVEAAGPRLATTSLLDIALPVLCPSAPNPALTEEAEILARRLERARQVVRNPADPTPRALQRRLDLARRAEPAGR